ncbi:MAG TPA: hypothetical protein VFK24_02175 [Gammaproteobacteria bacterium]|nr:hypothetical protein [Gammaproteobacteria bacterium]
MKTRRTISRFWWAPLTLLFLFGGAIQYLGLLTQTQTNVLVLALLLPVLPVKKALLEWRKEAVLFVFIAYMAILQLIHASPISYSATYVYYIACTIFAAVAGRAFCKPFLKRYSHEAYFRYAQYFLVLQVVVTTIQRFMAAEFVSGAHVHIGTIDAVFGTMYLQSDASLCVICLLITISFFSANASWRKKLMVTALSGVVVLNTNSSAGHIAYLSVVPFLLLSKLLNTRSERMAPFIVAGCGMGAAAIFYTLYNFDYIVAPFIHSLSTAFSTRYEYATADRLAPLGQMLSQDISFIGHGALTYYNPITKTWLYNAGFSTLYSLYIDAGLVAVMLYAIYYVKRISNFSAGLYFSVLIGICLTAYSMFNFTLSDLAFVFTLNFILQLQATKRAEFSVLVAHGHLRQRSV